MGASKPARSRNEPERAKPPSAPQAAARPASNGRDAAPDPADRPLAVLDDQGRVAKDAADLPRPSDEVLLRVYRTMSLIRQLDERMLVLQRQGRIGFWGPIRGQEAATVASCAAFEDRDWILPALREAGCALYRGFPLADMVSQTIGNALDRTRGRQMPCHFTFKEKNYVAMSSVIGTQIPHATGVAMAAKIRGDDVVAAGYLGDGATSSSDFHVALNFAAVAKAPAVFVCQNNQWAISVPLAKQTASRTIAQKAVAYGMPGVRVDGNDALAVYGATRRAVERARNGGGPTLLELVTYRVLGHSSSDDPTRYRDEKEVAAWTARDPIARLRRHLEARGLWDGAKQDEMEGAHAAAINDAIRVAEAAPPVDPRTLIEDVYRDVPAHLEAQYRESVEER